MLNPHCLLCLVYFINYYKDQYQGRKGSKKVAQRGKLAQTYLYNCMVFHCLWLLFTSICDTLTLIDTQTNCKRQNNRVDCSFYCTAIIPTIRQDHCHCWLESRAVCDIPSALSDLTGLSSQPPTSAQTVVEKKTIQSFSSLIQIFLPRRMGRTDIELNVLN